MMSLSSSSLFVVLDMLQIIHVASSPLLESFVVVYTVDVSNNIVITIVAVLFLSLDIVFFAVVKCIRADVINIVVVVVCCIIDANVDIAFAVVDDVDVAACVINCIADRRCLCIS